MSWVVIHMLQRPKYYNLSYSVRTVKSYSSLSSTMDAQIQAQLDRVEAALNTLIDSITSYNPSPAAAIALSNADDDLTQGLEQRSPPFHHPHN